MLQLCLSILASPVVSRSARDNPSASYRWSGKLPVSYQKPSLYSPGSPVGALVVAMSPVAGWLSAYCTSAMNSAPVVVLNFVPDCSAPRTCESSLKGPPGGLSSNTPPSMVTLPEGSPRSRTPSDDRG